MPLNLPRLPNFVDIVSSTRRATLALQNWWQTVVEALETNDARQNQLIADVQTLADANAAAIAAINAAQAAADAANAAAATAQSAATNAESAASTAQTAADSANNSIVAINTQISSLDSRVTSLETP